MKSSLHAILRKLFLSRIITRKELSVLTGLSSNRTNALIAQLLEQGILVESVNPDGNLGRPAALLSINPNIGYVVGVDIGVNGTRSVLTDLNGIVLKARTQPTQIVSDRNVIIRNILDMVEGVCQDGGVPVQELAGIGIGVMGIVDVEKSTVLAWTNKPEWAEAWSNFNVSEALQKQIQIAPIILDDTVRAMGVNAYNFGPARGTGNFLYVFLGSNIGSSLFIHGKPYFGSTGITGELGHVTIDEEGAWCSCGNRGCLETIASTPAVLHKVAGRLSEPRLVSVLRDAYNQNQLTLSKVIKAASVKDKLAYQVMDEVGRSVGKVLAFAMNLLGPEMVVLGGPLAQESDVLYNAIQHQVDLHALQQVSRHTRIVCDTPDEFSGTRGMALLTLNRIFSEDSYISKILYEKIPSK